MTSSRPSRGFAGAAEHTFHLCYRADRLITMHGLQQKNIYIYINNYLHKPRLRPCQDSNMETTFTFKCLLS